MEDTETYHLVKLWVDKEEHVFGPYSNLDQALAFLVNHTPKIASSLKTKNLYNYKAEVHECNLADQGVWETINLRITENKCRRK
jgi:hypothetical protein